jgi:acetyl esterase/lipase
VKLGLNPDRIATWGDGAGGNLAAMLATAAVTPDLDGDVKESPGVSPAVPAVVDWFGPTDFLEMDAQFAASGITPAMGKVASDSSFESKYIGQLITKDEDADTPVGGVRSGIEGRDWG